MSNYRPISTPTTFTKIYEFVIHGHVSNNLRTQCNFCQRGYIKPKPTATSRYISRPYYSPGLFSATVDAIFFRLSNASGPVLQELLCQHSVTADCLHNSVPKLFDKKNIRCTPLWSAFFATCVPRGSVTEAHLLSIFIIDLCGAVR
jgi:hypothetical protein